MLCSIKSTKKHKKGCLEGILGVGLYYVHVENCHKGQLLLTHLPNSNRSKTLPIPAKSNLIVCFPNNYSHKMDDLSLLPSKDPLEVTQTTRKIIAFFLCADPSKIQMGFDSIPTSLDIPINLNTIYYRHIITVRPPFFCGAGRSTPSACPLFS